MGSCPALSMLLWVGSPHLYRNSRFSHTRATCKDVRPFCSPGEIHRSCFCLRRHRPSTGCRSFSPAADSVFRFGSFHTHQGRQGLRRSPSYSDDRRTVDSSINGAPAPPSATPPSDRVLPRTRRRTATATGNAPRIDNGFWPAGPLNHVLGC